MGKRTESLIRIEGGKSDSRDLRPANVLGSMDVIGFSLTYSDADNGDTKSGWRRKKRRRSGMCVTRRVVRFVRPANSVSGIAMILFSSMSLDS